MFPASKAYELGVIDKLIPQEADLLKEAVTFMDGIISGQVDLKRQEQDFSQIDDVANMARQEVLKVTRGREIPGPMLASCSPSTCWP